MDTQGSHQVRVLEEHLVVHQLPTKQEGVTIVYSEQKGVTIVYSEQEGITIVYSKQEGVTI